MDLIKRYWSWAALCACLALAAWFQTSLWVPDAHIGDIYYLYKDGQRVTNGENPYSRVLQGNMVKNNKYATIFPAFIELSALTQWLHFQSFASWLRAWRYLFVFANLGIMTLLFWQFKSVRAPLLGLFAALLWSFNRWSLQVMSWSIIDFVPILLMALAVVLLPRRRWWALGLFSLSLAIKQMAVFLIPLFLIEAFCADHKRPWRAVLLSAGVIASVPLLTALPFLFWDAKGFLFSILFSATRSATQFAQDTYALDNYLQLTGLVARIPMLALFGMVYLAAWRNRGPFKMALFSLLTMTVFVGFNAILFFQYMPWFLIFIPLTAVEVMRKTPVLGEAFVKR